MGKKSKLLKSSLPRSAMKSLNKSMIKKEKNDEKEQNSISSDEDDNEEIENKNVKLNQTVNYDQNALKKHTSILGLNDKDINDLLAHPLRNRRIVHNTVLSKRQKKKLLREQKKEKLQLMEKNTKLNLTLNPYQEKKPLMNLIPSTLSNEKKNPDFNLKDLNNEIYDIVGNINQEEEKKEYGITKMRNKKKNRKLIEKEKAKIEAMIQKNNFNNNPLESVKMHIKKAQLYEKRNQIAKEIYNKNYNMLNLK